MRDFLGQFFSELLIDAHFFKLFLSFGLFSFLFKSLLSLVGVYEELLIHKLLNFFNNVRKCFCLCYSFLCEIVHQVSNWDDKSTNQRLVETLNDVVENRTGESWAEQLVSWQWCVEFDKSVQSWVGTWHFRVSLKVVQISTERGRHHAFKIELNESFLDRQHTCRLQST